MISFLLNLPYTSCGLILALVLSPVKVQWGSSPTHLKIWVRGTWAPLSYMKGWRAMAVGHVVLSNPKQEAGDMEHELIHVRQYQRLPLVFPLLYSYELMRKGYRNNRYEKEAYEKAGNPYYGTES